MGIVVSKGDKNSPLLNLCKERKELMRATRDARHHLAKSHLFYFHSLLGFTNALNHFVHKDLTVIPYSSDDDSSSSDELICSGSDSDSDCLACDRCKSNGDDQTPRPCSSSNNVEEKPREGLGFEEKEELLSAPIEFEERASKPPPSIPIEQNSFPGLDIFGLYGFADNTQFVFAEPDEDEWREVREREGIPDLESDSNDEHSNNRLTRMNRNKNKSSNGQESSSVAKANVKEGSSVANVECEEVDKSDRVEVSSCNGKVAKENCEQETIETPVIVTEEVCDNEAYETSSSSSSLESCCSGLTDLRNIVEKINSICEKAASNSEVVSELLEVSKIVHDKPLGTQVKSFASRVLGNSTRDPVSKPGGLRQENLADSLSTTLEKLYMWEKKLYAEVTVEEKLRVAYEKGYKILKSLDQSGAEANEIHEAEGEVKLLLSKINVSVRAVESISMRIHKIRDEELWHQVIGIVNGFKEMWRFLGKCHRKQFRAISRSKSCIHIVEKGSSSSRRATRKVGEEIRRYRESLRGYIDAQRGFVKALTEWLNRNIMEDDGTTEMEAPEIFRVCNEWFRAVYKVDESKVLSAVEEMGLRFRGIGVMQVEERKQRLRAERLRKELERKTKEAEEIWGTTVVGLPEEVLSLRESVAQERERHEKIIRELNDAASVTLQESLVSVFEALEDFSFGNFKAYQNIRIVSPETLLLCQS